MHRQKHGPVLQLHEQGVLAFGGFSQWGPGLCERGEEASCESYCPVESLTHTRSVFCACAPRRFCEEAPSLLSSTALKTDPPLLFRLLVCCVFVLLCVLAACFGARHVRSIWTFPLLPLLCAARGHFDLVAMILEAAVMSEGPEKAKKFCIDHMNSKRQTALMVACKHG